MAPKRKLKGKTSKRSAGVPARRRTAQTIAIGDQVRVPLQAANAFPGYSLPREPGEFLSEPIEGLVCSIREVSTGQLTAVASGRLDQFVFEILHSRTFNPRFSSEHNVGGARVARPVQEYDRWKRLRQRLRESAEKGQLLSHASQGLVKEVLGTMLQGWRVTKVRTDAIESMEAEVSSPANRPTVIEEPAEREIEYERPERRI